MDIVKEIGLPAMLGQLAEESAELAQAALKLQRILMGTNPTPVTREKAEADILEEATDVELCMQILSDVGVHTWDGAMAAEKLERWVARIKAAKEKTDWMPFTEEKHDP